jgi:hypothetical protein
MSRTTEVRNVSATIAAQNTFTDPLDLQPGEIASVSFILGTLAGTTIVLQRQLPGEAAAGTWSDVPNPDGTVGWIAATQQDYYASERQLIRIGCKTGGFGSGSGTVRLGKG